MTFYDDIEDAVLASDFEEYMKAENVKNVIRTIEEDDNCLVFFSGEKEGNDYIYVYKIKKKQNDKKIQYSQPMFGIAWEWKEKCSVLKQIKNTYKPSEWIEQMVRLDLNLINSSGAFNIDKEDKAFKCGFLSDKNIYRLKIDGKKPTEIIETTLDGDKVYFWYYKGIDMDPNNARTLHLSF